MSGRKKLNRYVLKATGSIFSPNVKLLHLQHLLFSGSKPDLCLELIIYYFAKLFFAIQGEVKIVCFFIQNPHTALN